MIQSAFLLKLGDGQEWQITGDQETEWLREGLAGITELKAASPDSRRTIFCTTKSQEHDLQDCLEMCGDIARVDRLPTGGWSPVELRLAEFLCHPESPHVICRLKDWGPDRITHLMQMQQSLYPIISSTTKSGGLLIHAALIERDGKGILIAAQGNTGKSTCCRRIPPPWGAVCDDMVLVVKNGDNSYLVHPFPTWSDYIMNRSEPTWNIQRHIPLSAIFFLRQSDVDEVMPLAKGNAALSIYASCLQANGMYERDLSPSMIKESRGVILDNAGHIANTTPAFILKATLTGQFWSEIEKALGLV